LIYFGEEELFGMKEEWICVEGINLEERMKKIVGSMSQLAFSSPVIFFASSTGS
jgi:hypothetical protein